MSSNANSTVLARKWRPKQFSELVGQSHVMQALANALDQQRLHHAYLFTGTRGVGKTTIARIFSKALNCEEGVSSTPCGECDICRSIDEGRFIDLIEVDAASRTKVDDTRELLDNVQFAPTLGRYKVYLIDEVHMLSKSSFNALLKTLEEPPEHVKFLLATTDPHKLPITVLSRCLQFNLMRLTLPQIQDHLAFIMEQEKLPFEKNALALIAKGADGSARDALSLLDQAIAYGAGEVLFEPVQTMLGLVDQQYSLAVLKALASEEPEALKEVIQQLAVMGVDYQALLAQLIETLHALSYCQVFNDSSALSTLPEEEVKALAELIAPERVQLLYQIALLAKQDMLLAPDIRIGFEMALIRMLAFQPAQISQSGQTVPESIDLPVASSETVIKTGGGGFSPTLNPASDGVTAQNVVSGLATARSLMAKKNEITPTKVYNDLQRQGGGENLAIQERENPAPFVAESSVPMSQSVAQPMPQSVNDLPLESLVGSSSSDHLAQIKARLKQPLGKLKRGVSSELSAQIAPSTPPVSPTVNKILPASFSEPLSEPAPDLKLNADPVPEQGGENIPPPLSNHQAQESSTSHSHSLNKVDVLNTESSENIVQWLDIIKQLSLKGMAEDVARNSVLVECTEHKMAISIDPEQNYSRQTMALEQLSNAITQHFGSDFELEFVSATEHFTPVKYEQQQAEQKLQQATVSIEQDNTVQAFQKTLGMKIVPESIKSI